MATFQYEQLETPSTIRIAILPPTTSEVSNGKIEVQLKHFEISSMSKKYYALSYVWGSGLRTHTISLNGSDFAVTENLMFFLRRKRPYPKPLLFWVDAICINQSDLDEKSKQVPLMREIYENSSLVHVELGPASKDEELVVQKMRNLSQFMAAELRRVRNANKGSLVKDQIHLPTELVEPYDFKTWNEIGKFFGKSWWERVWVMQEGTALRATRLFYGEDFLTFTEALGVNVALHFHGDQKAWGSNPMPTTNQYRIQRISAIGSLRTREGLKPLLEVLENFRGLHATDPRDIVYAALNLANDIHEGALSPNYKLPVFEVYRNVAAYYIENLEVPLDILAYCGTRFQHLEIPPGSASWIPLWDNRLPRTLLKKEQILSDGKRLRMYNAWGDVQFKHSNLFPTGRLPRIEGLTLLVCGFEIDRITFLSTGCITLEIVEAIRIANSWMPTDVTVPYLFTGETKLDVFLRTLVADITDEPQGARRGSKARWDSTSGKLISERYSKSESAIFNAIQLRRLAMGETGYMGLVSHQAQIGDVIYMLWGGSVPYLLRPKGDGFWIVGECYVHGLMDGEAMNLFEQGKTDIKKISII